MRSIVLIVPKSKNIHDYLKVLNETKYKTFNFKDNGVYLESSEGGFIDLSICKSLADDFDEEELKVVGRKKSELYFYQINFDDIELLKEVLVTAFNVDDVYINDDFNDIVCGSTFNKIVLKNPGWDWREWELQGKNIVT